MVKKYDNLGGMLTKSELLLCSVGAIALVAYSVSHQIDPAVATKELVDATLQATIYGLKSTLHFAYQTGKASGIVFGSYVALKAVAAVAIRVNKKVQARIAEQDVADEEENDEEDRCFQDETLLFENEVEPQAFAIATWNEDDDNYDEDDDEDYDLEDEEDVIETVIPDEAFNKEELTDLLADQKRVVFLHGAIKLPPFSPAENTAIKGPYLLRPR
jgi:hypothetical protein